MKLHNIRFPYQATRSLFADFNGETLRLENRDGSPITTNQIEALKAGLPAESVGLFCAHRQPIDKSDNLRAQLAGIADELENGAIIDGSLPSGLKVIAAIRAVLKQ